MESKLEISGLKVTRDGREVVHGVSLELPAGKLIALLGPNGSGKTSLVSAVMGHPSYGVSGGDVVLDGESIAQAAPDERARRGLFLSLQHPPEVPGVTVGSFLRAAWTAVSDETVGGMVPPFAKGGMADFRRRLIEELGKVRLDEKFLGRGLNEGFSGGEKKRLEMLQLAVLTPKFALLDETDSGLDVDALGIVTEGVRRALESGTGVLIITHNPKVLENLKPDAVHVMCEGELVASGGAELAVRIASEGYCGVGCKKCG